MSKIEAMTVRQMRCLFGRGADDVALVRAVCLVTPRLLVVGAAGAALAAVRHVVWRPMGVGVSVFGAAAAECFFREEARWPLTAEEGSAPG